MKYIDQLIERYPALSVCKKDIEEAAVSMIESFKTAVNFWLQVTVVRVQTATILPANF